VPADGFRTAACGVHSAGAFVILLPAIFVPPSNLFLFRPFLGLVDVFGGERSMLSGLTGFLGLPFHVLRHKKSPNGSLLNS
jgi:hypothetical protein